jgi:hypothetical protein
MQAHGPLTLRKDMRNLQKLLLESYPNIGLEESKFEHLASMIEEGEGEKNDRR